jgi:flagellar basal body P-ring formation protein FlgA
MRLAILITLGLCGLAHAETALVATRAIYPGQAILAESLRRVELSGARSTDMAGDAAEVSGMVAVRTILPGRPIAFSMLRKPHLIEAGKPVRIEYVHDGLTISLAAMPLGSGGAGDMIQLRNPGSGKSIMGLVRDDGTVVVGP